MDRQDSNDGLGCDFPSDRPLAPQMQQLRITRPDDWHIHLRDGEMLATTVADAARIMGRAIVMPNLKPPITGCEQAAAYRSRILAQRLPNSAFNPLMTLYLTDNTSPEEISAACDHPHIYAVKYYPAGATTNSDSGVTRLENCFHLFEIMAQKGLPLLVHGEVTDTEVDIFDREQRFIEQTLSALVQRFPTLKIVMEHITTADAVDFVTQAPANVAATVTPQHLLFNRNDMLVGGIRPHFYCLPILKRNRHQIALREAVTGGSSKFFLGTDSAPHLQHTKETSCGCAGCYTAPAALELYASVFEEMQALNKLEGFASFHGPDFYGLPRNPDQITLIQKEWQVPASIEVGAHRLIPLMAGETLRWQIVSE